MRCEPQGCGRSGLTLTLYVISEEDVNPLSTGFHLLRCGYFPTSFDPHSIGMLLCESCANRCGFPKASAAAAHG